MRSGFRKIWPNLRGGPWYVQKKKRNWKCRCAAATAFTGVDAWVTCGLRSFLGICLISPANKVMVVVVSVVGGGGDHLCFAILFYWCEAFSNVWSIYHISHLSVSLTGRNRDSTELLLQLILLLRPLCYNHWHYQLLDERLVFITIPKWTLLGSCLVGICETMGAETSPRVGTRGTGLL